jgi:hypothetical protein
MKAASVVLLFNGVWKRTTEEGPHPAVVDVKQM